MADGEIGRVVRWGPRETPPAVRLSPLAARSAPLAAAARRPVVTGRAPRRWSSWLPGALACR